MLTNLRIENFKGIQKCKVSDLRRINLFIGKNDSGKSTILEAAYYSLKEHYSSAFQNVMNRRTDEFTGGTELWFKYGTQYPIVISARIFGVLLKVTLTMSDTTILSEFSGALKDPKTRKLKEWKFLGNQYSGADFSFSLGRGNALDKIPLGKRTRGKLDAFIPNMSLIDCTLKSETSTIEARLGELKIAGRDREFGSIVEDAYGKGKEWEFLPHKDRPSETRLAIREAGRLTYFGDFGDGLRYGLGILGTAMTSRHTALFIEEIEGHQHRGSLRKLLRHLVEIARKNDLQIFLSTHSHDVWESLSRGVYIEDTDSEKKEFRCFLVERDAKSGGVIVKKTDDVAKITQALGRP